MTAREKKLLYHMTEISNLTSIWCNGLLSRRQIKSNALSFNDVADEDILDGREDHDLDALVPFHFFTRSPFDYAVVRGNPDSRFVFLAVRRAFAAENGWKVIPRHPLADAKPPQVLEWSPGLEAIDWTEIDKPDRDYSNQKCRIACMAEALSPERVEASNIFAIYVLSDHDKQSVEGHIPKEERPYINVNPGMFPSVT